MKCTGCVKGVKEANTIVCKGPACNRRYCNNCVNINALTPNRINTWICPKCCVQERKGGENSTNPMPSSSDTQNVTTRIKSNLTTNFSGSADFQDLLTEVKLLTQEITCLKNKLQDATTSLNRCHERLDMFGATNESRICVLENRNHEIETLKKTASELQTELNKQAQNQLKNEIELCGIPESPNENVTHIALLVARHMGVELSDTEVDWSTRAGPRVLSATNSTGNATRPPRPIVMRLLRRIKRDELLKASKSRRNITSTDMSLPGPAQKVFVNERLTLRNRTLFRECRLQTRQMGYKFCWCSNGTIYVRQHEGKSAIPIWSMDDLQQLVDKTKTTEIPIS